jgi:ferric-dicitrate binding protein FerR (iron transport regulator)
VKAIIQPVLAVVASLLFSMAFALAQAPGGCSPSNTGAGTQTLRCEGGITIVAENGARYSLSDANHDGRVDSIELSAKALLIEVPKQARGRKFQVNTPQAIAAVRGTKWAVDAADGKTSVLVVDGRVTVRRRAKGGEEVVLGPGEGVDVEASGPLTVKVWGAPRVQALMARLGQ